MNLTACSALVTPEAVNSEFEILKTGVEPSSDKRLIKDPVISILSVGCACVTAVVDPKTIPIIKASFVGLAELKYFSIWWGMQDLAAVTVWRLELRSLFFFLIMVSSWVDGSSSAMIFYECVSPNCN
jgi:hypothetical protein